MITAKAALKRLFPILPAQHQFFRACRSFVNHYKGENNDDQKTNGELRLLCEIIPSCKVAFDVGANLGDWAQEVVDVNPDIQVYCFEPVQSTFERLCKRFEGKPIRCFQNAIGKEKIDREMYIYGENDGSNSLHLRSSLNIHSKIKSQSVIQTTIDSFCLEHAIEQVDFIKVDTEGNDLDVLKGAQNCLKNKRIRNIQFEYGGTYIDSRILLKDFYEFLKDYGGKIYKIYPSRIEEIPVYKAEEENFQYKNFLVRFY